MLLKRCIKRINSANERGDRMILGAVVTHKSVIILIEYKFYLHALMGSDHFHHCITYNATIMVIEEVRLMYDQIS